MQAYKTAWAPFENMRNDYTPEGLAKSYSHTTRNIAAKLETARAQLAEYATGIEKIMPAERARILPPAPAGGFTVAQELAAARILNRRVEWDISTYVAAVEPLAGTPTATLITEELDARNRLTVGAEDVLLNTVSERYAAMAKLHPLILAGINGPLKSVVREAERASDAETWFGNRTEPGRYLVALSNAHGPLTIDTSNGYVHSDELPPLPKKS